MSGHPSARRRVAVIGSGVAGLTRRARARPRGPGHPLRGGRPARRARRHPRGRRDRGRHRLHRAQRAHLPQPDAALRRARRADPGLRHVDVGALRRRPGWSGPARSGWPVCSRPGATRVRPSYLRMLVEIPRFHRMARRVLLETADGQSDETLASFLERGRFSPLFRTHFMESLVACVWSCDPAVALEYPARYLFAFLQHHGMLAVFGSPQWRTVTGGSREYVAKVAARHPRRAHRHQGDLGARDAHRRRDHRRQRPGRDLRRRRRGDPSRAGARRCSPSRPRRSARCSRRCRTRPTPPSCTPTPVCCRALTRARASWNYLRRPSDDSRTVTVSYDMTRLMRLPVPTDGRRFIVTLGGQDIVDQGSVIETMEYEHPIYTPASVAAQRRLPECDTDRLVFAGAWHGWGFHEDGARSGVEAAAQARGRVGRGTSAAAQSSPRRTPPRSGTPAASRSSAPSAPVADLAGRPRPPARPRGPRPVRGARPPRRPGLDA